MDKVIKLKTKDNKDLFIKISYPKEFQKIVLYVNGLGPNTYDNTRMINEKLKINYHDLFRNELNKRNVSYVSYNARGVDVDVNYPFYKINEDLYKTNNVLNALNDLEVIVNYLKKEYKQAKIYLLTFGEASIIATNSIYKNKLKVDGLFIVSYFHDSFKDILEWQFSGNSLLLNILAYLNLYERDYLLAKDFENDNTNILKDIFNNESFPNLDLNKDGKIDATDLKPLTYPFYEKFLLAVDNGDEKFFEENIPFKVYSSWYKEMFSLPANKEILPMLDIPIYIFQGRFDNQAPFFGIDEITSTFKDLNKSNLKVYIYERLNQDLNYFEYIFSLKLSNGLIDLFEVIKNN